MCDLEAAITVSDPGVEQLVDLIDAPTEKWIVWPAAGPGKDPREDELATKGIRVVS